MNKEEFIEALKELGITLTEDQNHQLDQFYHLMLEWNKKINLTRIIKEEDVYLKHFYDSLTIIKAIDIDNQYILDVGSGAGFPGMVLKIIFPNIKIDLLDATNKKCEFLKMVIKKLSLKDINVINARCEEYAKTNREKYDLVTSRAVAPLKHLLEYSIPVLKINGTFVALKSNIEDEIKNIDNYYQKLFLSDEKKITFKLPIEESNRTLYSIVKKAKTPDKYPRMYNQIIKKDI